KGLHGHMRLHLRPAAAAAGARSRAYNEAATPAEAEGRGVSATQPMSADEKRYLREQNSQVTVRPPSGSRRSSSSEAPNWRRYMWMRSREQRHSAGTPAAGAISAPRRPDRLRAGPPRLLRETAVRAVAAAPAAGRAARGPPRWRRG